MSTRVGKYEVLTRLAKGGMAELSLATTSGAGGFRKFVVLKQILAEAADDENFVKMFLDEARVTAAFSHPSICQVFEMGDDRKSGLYVAMEFIAGQDLNQVVAACAKQQAVLPIGFSASVVHDCALALHYAHTFKLPNGEESPVIHRDVAQKNIMVTYEGQVKLLDFGIAKAKGALSRTRAGTVKGTAGYMSPEQVRGDAIDGRSDVFSLGVVLWEMVTGRRLFSAESELAELKMILNDPITPPHEVEPSVPRELSDIAMKALQRDLNLRFRSARDMAKTLSSTCGHLLFDVEERADFMIQRFEEKIVSTRRLFDSASKDAQEVDAAVEDFRRSSAHERETDEVIKKRPPVSVISGSKFKAVKAGPSAGRLPHVSSGKLKKVGKPPRKSFDDATAPVGEALVPTEAQVPTTAPPRSASMLWPVLGVGLALVVGGLVWFLMRQPPGDVYVPPRDTPGGEVTPPPPRLGELPGTDTLAVEPPPNTPKPKTDKPETPNPVVKKDPPPKTQPRERGEVTLFLIPEATVSKGGQQLGKGSVVPVSLPVGTHLVTVTGTDGVRRHLSLQISAGKNPNQKFRLDDLPPE